MGKSKAPEYATTNVNTGLYGTSTTNKSGTTYKPSGFQSQLVNTVEQNVPGTLNEYLNPSYNSELYQKQKAQREKEQIQAYDTSVLSQLANRGLMRSSGLQAATNSFAETLANQEAQAMADYKTEKANELATLMGLYEVPYNMMMGTNNSSQSLSNSVSNYNMQKYQADKLANNGLYGALGQSIGGLAAAGGTIAVAA